MAVVSQILQRINRWGSWIAYGKVVTPALDGKTLRGSYDNKNGEKALHLLMAFCTNNKIILGHVNVTKDKTNEIPCAQEMIADLGLANGAVYTLDALHCQKKLLRTQKRLVEK